MRFCSSATRQRLDAVFVLVGVHERGDEVVGRLGPPGLEHRREMMLRLEFDLDGLEHLVVGQRAHRQRQHGAGPAVEAVDLGAVEAELLGDDDARQRHGEVEVELALAPIDQPVDQPSGDVVDVGRHVGDATREERLRDEPAIVGVDGRVGALQGLDVAPPAFAEDLLVAAGVVDLEALLRAAARVRCSRTAPGW